MGSVFIQPMTLSIILVNSAINLGLWLNECIVSENFHILFYHDKTLKAY